MLLDTSVLLWWLVDSPRLSARARAILRDPGTELVWSAASTWEIAIKSGLGKVTLHRPLHALLADQMATQRILSLPVQHEHAWGVADLPPHHRDPFDRLLVSQARAEDLTILTPDAAIAAYDVRVIW